MVNKCALGFDRAAELEFQGDDVRQSSRVPCFSSPEQCQLRCEQEQAAAACARVDDARNTLYGSLLQALRQRLDQVPADP